jgi:opine dehydrogenase
MIAKELGVKVKTIFDHFNLSFHIPKASIYEMNQNMHKRGNGGIGPNTAESRYVIEDIPYGVQFTILLGRLVNKPAILHESGMAIFSAMYNRNFSKENKLLNALNPKSLNIQNLQHASRTGMIQ